MSNSDFFEFSVEICNQDSQGGSGQFLLLFLFLIIKRKTSNTSERHIHCYLSDHYFAALVREATYTVWKVVLCLNSLVLSKVSVAWCDIFSQLM